MGRFTSAITSCGRVALTYMVSRDGAEWRSPGTIFVSGLAGLWRRFGPSLGIGSLVLGSRSRVIIMKKNVKQRTVNVYVVPMLVVDKAQLPELVHEETNTRACRPYHRRQSLLAKSRD